MLFQEGKPPVGNLHISMLQVVGPRGGPLIMPQPLPPASQKVAEGEQAVQLQVKRQSAEGATLATG